jgi:hypothetical protein
MFDVLPPHGFRFFRWHCITSFAAWEEVILKKCTILE